MYFISHFSFLIGGHSQEREEEEDDDDDDKCDK